MTNAEQLVEETESNVPRPASVTVPTNEVRCRLLRRWPPVVTAVFISLVCLTLPTPAPDLGVDASWCAVLQWAHEHSLQFGKDIVFTYGPLGYAVAPYCLAQPGSSVLVINALVGFGSVLGLTLIAWRLGVVWRCVLLIFFGLTASNAEFRLDLLLTTGLFSWGLLCLLESGWKASGCVAGFVALAVFAALSKVVYLFAAGFSVCAVTLALALGKKNRMQWFLIPAFVFGFVLAWMALGQAVTNLGSFSKAAYLISKDYELAVAMGGLPRLRFWGFWLGVTASVPILMQIAGAFEERTARAWWKKTVILGWAGMLLVLVWKHSLVRLDRMHFFDLAVFAPVAGLALAALPGPPSSTRLLGRLTSIFCCGLSLLILESAFLPGWIPSVVQVFSQFSAHTKSLFAPRQAAGRIESELEPLRRGARRPELCQKIGPATVDVFGFHQSYAILNQLNYKPRPVFQSYAAYNATLAALNESFYLSQDSPEYVLLELSSLEHRFAVLDDALALRAILANYNGVANESGFLLLKRSVANVPSIRLIRQGYLRPGEHLDLADYRQTNLWLEIRRQLTPRERLTQALKGAEPLRLCIWTNSASGPVLEIKRQASISGLATGFMCSPFLLQTEDARGFLSGLPQLCPAAISLEVASPRKRTQGDRYWFRLFVMQTQLNPSKNGVSLGAKP